jgi:hypothetical protein
MYGNGELTILDGFNKVFHNFGESRPVQSTCQIVIFGSMPQAL